MDRRGARNDQIHRTVLGDWSALIVEFLGCFDV